jgi:glycosyltransferase involved in cell wall biosynthesis
MKKIGVLVLNNFLNDNRVHKIACSLSGAGHRVTVIAFLKGNVQEFEKKEHYQVHRIRLRASSLPNGNKLFGALKYLEFIFKIVRSYRKCDILHCNDFEAMFVGFIAKLTRPKLVLVYDCHEYERERAEMNWIKKWSTRIFEPIVIRFAQQVFVVSEGIKEEYHRLYPHAKVELIMNAPHLQTFEKKEVFRKHFGLRDNQKIFLYQGGLLPSRGVECLLNVFSTMKNDEKVIVFMGFGPLTDKIKSLASQSTNIYYHEAVPYNQIVDFTSSADVGMITTQNVALNNYYCLPNKLFEYIHAEIPIITNNLYDCRKIVEGNGIGTVIESFDETGVLNAIQELEKMNLQEVADQMSRIKEKYCWQFEEKKLLLAYSNLYA